MKSILTENPMGPLEETARKMAKIAIDEVQLTEHPYEVEELEKQDIDDELSILSSKLKRQQLGSDEEYKATHFRDGVGFIENVKAGYITGLDIKDATLQLQLRFASELRCSLEGRSGRAKAKKVPLKDKARRVKNIMRTLYSNRRGINPVNLNNLRGRQGNKDVTLVDLRSLGDIVSDLGLEGSSLVARFIRESDVVTPKGELTRKGAAKLKSLTKRSKPTTDDVSMPAGDQHTTTPTPSEERPEEPTDLERRFPHLPTLVRVIQEASSSRPFGESARSNPVYRFY